ncbi:pyridoxal phosphate-dependent aminotransferase [Desulfobulbus oligotrophicus]|jgi:aspartate/methionine/tyrosine aminotransferase|uniref:alanine transaminase n=1 Tax=Desulfobulbus oligotrophicus TaxID=1909699 RepID=A0A7T5VF09_9BACT|nr:pyridoxal phosphate-dependent aminotransferase [Desulfobulbus oligotrophicus]MDY0390668.1 pyridoxal phosphate-dependent aminotransferase [Desulfobulbus oligotrophicus]QQG66720.1 pyridoxal phosphate-dependent aminotransferase [Desulfobulbus oligotrophicus]
MRTDILHIGAGELNYEIRNIVGVGEKLQKMGVQINWENIGDPITKGEKIPEWMKDIVAEAVREDATYAYSPTRGLLATREFVASCTNSLGGVQIDADDVIFFNGLGDAISKVYGLLRPPARVLVPTPSYTTHSSAEAAHASDRPVTYILDPNHLWYPDLEDIENHVKYNPAVAGILVINPDNPTGAVYPADVMRAIVEICEKNDLFIICDEIYQNMTYNGTGSAPLCTVIGNKVPAICMRGISKEMPWPGSRCGWIEVYNRRRDPMFATYVQSILDAKMLEVCSTTLPQVVLPRIKSHPEYTVHLKNRIKRYERYSNLAYDILKNVKGLLVNRTNGAFYMSAVFEEGVLNHKQILPIMDTEVRETVEQLVAGSNVQPDKRFVYYLLAATGICVVPLSSFATELQGFRITLLEQNEEDFVRIFQTIASSIQSYINSHPICRYCG